MYDSALKWRLYSPEFQGDNSANERPFPSLRPRTVRSSRAAYYPDLTRHAVRNSQNIPRRCGASLPQAMTSRSHQILARVAFRGAAVCLWSAGIWLVAVRYFWPKQLIDWLGRERVRDWIAQSGIPPKIGFAFTVIIWLVSMVFAIWWLPLYLWRKGASHEPSA